MAALRNAQAYIGSIQGYGMAISEAPNSILLDVSTAEPIGRRWRRALGPDLDGYGFVLPAAIIMTALIVPLAKRQRRFWKTDASFV